MLLYADVNTNIVDGSSIWLQSVSEALSRAGAVTHVLLKSQIRTSRIVSALEQLDDVHLHAPLGRTADPDDDEQSYGPREAARKIAHFDDLLRPDVILCRGLSICAYVVKNPSLAGRLWAYVTDIPRVEAGGAATLVGRLQDVVSASRVVLAQTEDARAYLEAVAPSASGKTLLLPPMVPDDLFTGPVPARALEAGQPVRLVYSGKFAKAWRTLEMLELPDLLQQAGVPATLTMIGDKVQDDPVDAGWAARMRAALDGSRESPSSVDWVGGLARSAALEQVRTHHVGLSWRDVDLDASLELSTKLLEYAAVGVPPLVNRTVAHEGLLGDDYPLFTDSRTPVDGVLAAVARSPQLLQQAAQRARAAVVEHSMSTSGQRLAEHLSRYAVRRPSLDGRRRTRVVVAGHDFKFAADVFNALLSEPETYEVRVDQWAGLHRHDEARSRELIEWADVAFCEWAGPNSVWYSRHKRPRQKLVVRLHGFEVRGPWLGQLEHESVDRMIFVSDSYRQHIQQVLGWSQLPTTTVSNSVDTRDLDRPKVPGAQFHLGILGVVPILKRPDRALALLAELVAHDPRFVLHIKGRAPWDYPWEWQQPLQQDAYATLLEQAADSGLLEHVAFERFSPAVGSWHRKIGWILSPSSRESFHLAPLEGMAAGSVPVFWRRPGVEEIYGSRWVVDEASEASGRILGVLADGRFRDEAGAAKEYAARFDALVIRRTWSALFHGL